MFLWAAPCLVCSHAHNKIHIPANWFHSEGVVTSKGGHEQCFKNRAATKDCFYQLICSFYWLIALKGH